MKRTLIVPATIALLTGLAATAQETNTMDADVNASANAEYTAEVQDVDDLSIEELNALQLKALENPAQTDSTGDLLFTVQSEGNADTESTSDTMVMADAETGARYEPTLDEPEMADPLGDTKSHEWDETQQATIDAEANIGMGGPDYSSEAEAMTDTAMKGSIVELASEDPRFTTFVELVNQAELAGMFEGDATYTVFAPTNAAFEKLDADLVETLKSGEANEKLASVLKAHIIEGETMSQDITEGETTLATLAEADLVIEKTGDSVTVGNATVIAADIDASNGVIHAVDTVIMPNEDL